MKFYDRKKELKLLQDINEQSRNSACFTVMVGRRRIGKTALLLESVRGKKFLYLFVSRKVKYFYANSSNRTSKKAWSWIYSAGWTTSVPYSSN